MRVGRRPQERDFVDILLHLFDNGHVIRPAGQRAHCSRRWTLSSWTMQTLKPGLAKPNVPPQTHPATLHGVVGASFTPPGKLSRQGWNHQPFMLRYPASLEDLIGLLCGEVTTEDRMELRCVCNQGSRLTPLSQRQTTTDVGERRWDEHFAVHVQVSPTSGEISVTEMNTSAPDSEDGIVCWPSYVRFSDDWKQSTR